MRKWIIGSVTTLTLLYGGAVFLQAQSQCGGSFVPTLNCIIPGHWNFTNTTNSAPFDVSGAPATGIISASVDLTNAQVLALNLTPVTLIAAPGAGKYIDVVGATLAFKYTAAYTSPQNVRLYYGNRMTGAAASATVTGSGFFDASANKVIRVAGVPDNTNPPITSTALVIEQVVYAAMGGGNASNSVRVTVNYRIVNTGL